MKFFAVAALFAGALTMPTAEIEARTEHSYTPCNSSLFSNPVCAATDVAGAICLNAAPPSEVPKDAVDFQRICAKSGQQARCAVLPILGQAILCIEPVGVR